MYNIRDLIFDLKKKDIHLEIKGEKLLVLSDIDLSEDDIFVIQNNKNETIKSAPIQLLLCDIIK